MSALDTFTGTFHVVDAGTDVTTGNGVAYSVESETGCDAQINPSTGVYKVVSVSANTGFAIFKAQYKDHAPLFRGFSVAVARAGRDGTIGSNGTNGVSAITAQLSPESASVWAFANGNPEDYNGVRTVASVYSGQTNVTASFTFAVTANPQSLTFSWSGNALSVTGGLGNNTDNASLTVTFTGTGQYTGVSITKVFVVTKVKSGYQIVSTLPTTNLFEGREVFLSTDKTMYIYKNGQWTNRISAEVIESGTLKATAFAEGIEPVGTVTGSTLPSTKSTTFITLTSGGNAGKLYRWNGSAYILAVNSGDLSGQLTSDQIASLTAAKLTGSITTTQISNDAITTPKIAAGAVTTTELASNSVTTLKLAAGAVTTDTLATNSVTSGKILAGSVTAEALASNSVTTAKLAAGAVTATQLAAGAITTEKLAVGLRGATVQGIYFEANASLNRVTWTSGTIFYTADNGALITQGIPAGSANFTNGFVYISYPKGGSSLSSLSGNNSQYNDKNNYIPMAVYEGGTGLTVVTGQTIINGDKITTGSLDADRIKAGTITSAQLATTELITTSAQIRNGTIDMAKISNLVVGNAQIQNLSVGTIKIANSAVTQVWFSTNQSTIYPALTPNFTTMSYLYFNKQLGSESVIQMSAYCPLVSNNGIDVIAYLDVWSNPAGGAPVDNRGFRMRIRTSDDTQNALLAEHLFQNLPAGNYEARFVMQRANSSLACNTQGQQHLMVREFKK